MKKLSGLILGLKPHAEYDRRIILFSLEEGLTTIMAKGVRRAKSHRSFHLDLLNEVTLELEESLRGRSRIPYLREVSTKTSFPKIKNHPPSFAAACLAASFLLRILPFSTPQEELVLLTKRFFSALEEKSALKGESDAKKLLMPYFLKAGQLLGYLPKNLPRANFRTLLQKTLTDLDPQFTLQARRTLGIFSSFESTRSS